MKRLTNEVDGIALIAADYAQGRLNDLETIGVAWNDALRAIYDYENGRCTEQNAKDAIQKAEELERKLFA
jgi:hypothetical protein